MLPVNKEINGIHTSASFLKSELIRNGIMDPEGTHHEFVSGKHGQKLDFDKIPSGSTLYNLWVGATANAIRELYPDHLPDVIVGVANGANRLARGVAPIIGDEVKAIETEKVSAKEVAIGELGKFVIAQAKPEFVLVVEDVGTAGGTTVTAINALKQEGVEEIEILVTWQRQSSLAKLDEIEAVYHAVIYDPLPTYEPEECRQNFDGFCSRGWQLIPHDS